MDRTTIGPGVLDFSATLTLRTGSRRLVANVGAVSPWKSHIGAGKRMNEAQTIVETDRPRLLGPGKFGDGSFGFGDVVQPSRAPCHVAGPQGSSVDVYIPPHSTTRMVFKLRATDLAPWLGESFAPMFRISRRLEGLGHATLKRGVLVRAHGPVWDGPLAARIDMRTTPAATPNVLTHGRPVALGTPIAFDGQLWPAESGRTILIKYFGPGAIDQPALIASVLTDASGRFSQGGWLPVAAGNYELFAEYPQQPGDLLADGMCGLGLNVKGR